MAVEDLISEWERPGRLPSFHAVSDGDFLPAFRQAIEKARQRISDIADNPEPATFENVIAALELADPELERAGAVFFLLAGADSNEDRQAIEREIVPELVRFETEMAMNRELYERVNTLWEQRDSLCLDDEQLITLKRHRRDFLHSGATLPAPQQQRFAEIREELSRLHVQFGQNLLADESEWYMELGESDLSGLPDFLLQAARQAAADRHLTGHVVTLDRSLIEPFLKFADGRDLRRTAYQAWAARGANGGPTDNRQIASRIAALRHEMASLLGYRSYAELNLEDEMAGTPDAARSLLEKVWEVARAAAMEDAARHQEALNSDGHSGRLQAWDWRYYAERLRASEHRLDEAEIKQYFQLRLLTEAAFHVAGRLFDLTFHELDAQAYHPDCRVWEVRRGGSPCATFIADHFARPSKQSGAWCTGLSNQHRLAGGSLPVVVNVCNFMKPPAGEPCLLSHDDARTLFHEFGHALHAILSDVTYPSVSGTSVARDFVELPSQLFESWLDVGEVLDRFAVHARTGARIPAELRRKLAAARNFDQGFATVEYLASAFVDLDFHSGEPPSDLVRRQDEVLAVLAMPEAIGMRHATPHFAHVFSGSGYAAGYYSYLWADVLAADAFEAFQDEGGPFCRDTAARLARCILSAGGTREAEELYLAFRGRLPTADALLRKRGLADVRAGRILS